MKYIFLICLVCMLGSCTLSNHVPPQKNSSVSEKKGGDDSTTSFGASSGSFLPASHQPRVLEGGENYGSISPKNTLK